MANNEDDEPNPPPASSQSEVKLQAVPPPPETLSSRQRGYFFFGGMLFLAAGLILFLGTGLMLYRLLERAPSITISEPLDKTAQPSSSILSQKEIYHVYGILLSAFLAPLIGLLSAIFCTSVGIKLLRSGGAVTTSVISPQDYPILGPAIASGNEQAITQWIRINSLSGLTGTFTKMGISGLPLATIVLTLLLALAGLANNQFFDLAKLTLGAFLGSFVQRQAESRRSPADRL